MTTIETVTTPDDTEFEELVHCTDEESGLDSIIAIHDTTLGPSLGGIRMRSYPSHASAAADAKRLAEAMSYKAAMAGLDLGGGKSVINANPNSANRTELLLAHGRQIEALGGRYIPAVDMGTSVADLNLLSSVVSTVSSRLRDPSTYTAEGIVAAIRAAVEVTENSDLAGKLIGIQGLGHVGSHIASLLAADGAHLVVADIDADRTTQIAAQTGARVVAPADILAADVDILCPCAAGGVITTELAERLTARYVIGAANNMLAKPELASVVRERGVVYVPDFIANAGGLIACAAEALDIDAGLSERVGAIAETTRMVLRESEARDSDTYVTGIELAKERIDRARNAGAPR